MKSSVHWDDDSLKVVVKATPFAGLIVRYPPIGAAFVTSETSENAESDDTLLPLDAVRRNT